MKWTLIILLFANMSLTYSQPSPMEMIESGDISSTEQAFYMFEEVFLDDIPIENDDWVVVFNGEICVGFFQWDTSNCGGEICSVPALGDDGETFTEGFLNQEDIPTFKIYDTSEDAYHDAIPSENIPWENGQIYLIDKLESYSYHDCEGSWGGNAIIDDCGICSEGFTGHVPNSDKDCAGTCPNQSENITFYGSCMLNYETPQPGFCGYDECGICDGNGANIMCWDDSFVCNIDDCPFNPSDCPEGTTYLNYYLGNNDAKDAQKCIPDSFLNNGGSVESSTQQFSYIFHVVTLNGALIDTTDWIAAFNGDICVGAKLWNTSNCNSNICNVVVMGFETNDPAATQGYCESGDVPTFKIYDISENAYHDAIPSENIPWDPLTGSTFIDTLSFCNLAIDCIGECGGMAEIDECGVCGGNGIADGACDCDGNVDLGCGCGEGGPSGCDNTCDSNLENDECGVCGGDGIDEGTCDCDSNLDTCSLCPNINPNGYGNCNTVLGYAFTSEDCELITGCGYGTDEEWFFDTYNECNTSCQNCKQLDLDGYGSCEMVLGWGWIGDSCKLISGCGMDDDAPWFYDNEETCKARCSYEHFLSNEVSALPQDYTLSSYPNPFNPILNISYKLPIASYTSIIVHNINGKKIMKINNGFQSSGNYSTNWDASNQASGVYLINLVNENNKSLTKIQKAILIK